MTVSDEAVEAAAEAMYHKFNGLIRPALVKVILEAAAPFIAAQAFESGYGHGYSDAIWQKGHNPRESNPYRSGT